MSIDPSTLPLYLRAEDIAQLFGISRSSAYALLHAKDGPPVLYIGKRLCVPRDRLLAWIEEHTH